MKKLLVLLFFGSLFLTSCNFSDEATAPQNGSQGSNVTSSPQLKHIDQRPAMFFYQYDENVEAVFVIGEFNGWDKEANKLTLNQQKTYWLLDLNLAPGRYLYKFYVKLKNGQEQWPYDPYSMEELVYDSEYDTYNSVVVVGETPDQVANGVVGSRPYFVYKTNDANITAVAVAGSFNEWNPAANYLQFNQQKGQYELDLYLYAGTHAYKYVLYNGDKIIEWVTDPRSGDLDADGNSTVNVVVDPDSITYLDKDEKYTFNFENTDSEVTAVYVVGDFNGWNTRANKMVGDGSNHYSLAMELGSGTYFYKFVLYKGKDIAAWVTDPTTLDKNLFDDHNGGLNSRLIIKKRNPAPVVLKGEGHTFSFFATNSNISGVSIVGDFNDWDPEANPMYFNKDSGDWELILKLVAGDHYYKFVTFVDGKLDQYLTDPKSDKSVLVEDGFGGYNTKLHIAKIAQVVEQGEGRRFILKLEDEDLTNVTSASIVGTFNDWNIDANPMTFNRAEKVWEINLLLDKGEHTYKFVTFKNEEIYKWLTDTTTAYKDLVDDSNGGLNSKLVIGDNGQEVTTNGLSSAMFYYCSADSSIVRVRLAVEYYEFQPIFPLSYNRANGCWELSQLGLPNDRWEYKFVLYYANGEESWIYDPKSTVDDLVADPYGGFNSLVTVGPALPDTFTFTLKQTAKTVTGVFVSGEFNDWSKTAAPMIFNEQTKEWSVSLKLKRGKYRYRLMILHGEREEWIADRNGVDGKTKLIETDMYGDVSVIVVR